MSTLRISNIEAKADNSSPTVDEQLKITNSTGDVMLHLDGRTSGITTVGINTTAQTIKFDENNNVFITGIVTATELHGTVAVGTSITYGDNEKAYFGADLDLEIYHGSGHSRIVNNLNSGALKLQSNQVEIVNKANTETLAQFFDGGACSLRFNNSTKFSTTASGVDCPDQLQVDGTTFATGGLKINADNQKLRIGAGDDLEIWHQSSDESAVIKNVNDTGWLRLLSGDSNSSGILLKNRDDDVTYLRAKNEQGVELFHGNSVKFETTSDGIQLTSSNHVTQVLKAGGSTSDLQIQFKDSSGNIESAIFCASDAGDLRFKTGGTNERLRINSTGHLSLGGSNVTDVNLLTLNGSGASQNIGIVFNKTNSPAKAHGIQVNNATGDLIFYDYTGSAERLRVRSDGRVSIASSLAVAGVCTATTFVPSSGQLGNRNLIINGAMQVAQRATTSTTSGYASLDRMRVQFVGHDEAMTHAQHTLTSSDTGPWAEGFRHSLHITNGNQTGGAGAGDYSRVEYNIEAKDMATSGWDYTSSSSYITLSYWVKCSVAQNFYNYMRAADGTAQGYSWETGTLSANTWKKVTKTIPGNANLTFDNDVNTGLALSFSLFMGTNFTDSGNTMNAWAAYASANRMPDNTSTWYTTNDSTYEITGIQLEVSPVATPFEHRSYGDELLRCQRYYQVDRSSNVNSMYESATTYNGKWYQKDHTIEMRAKPTVSTTNGTNSISNSGWTGSTPTAYSSNTHTVYYSSGNAFHLAGTSDGNIGATYDSEL